MDPAATAAPPARPPYGGGMEEYNYRSRPLRWCISAMGVAWILLGLYSLLLLPPLFKLANPSPTPTASDATLLTPEQQQALQEMRQENRVMEERNRLAGCLLACALCLNSIFFLTGGACTSLSPWATLRRGRRRAADWQASRRGGPYYLGGSLVLFVLIAFYWNIGFGLACASIPVLSRPDADIWSEYVSYGIWQSIGIAFLILVVAAMLRRRHFRSWRLQVEAVPVLPGEAVAFEISRKGGRPLGAGLRLELVGNTFYWSWNPLKAWKAMYRQSIPGDVQANVPAAGQAAAIKGTLRIDAAGLSLMPPPGIERPGPPLRLPPRAAELVDAVPLRDSSARGLLRGAG